VTPDALVTELAAGVVRPAYLLVGGEALLRDDALFALRRAVLSRGPAEFNHDRLEGESTPPAALTDALRTLPVGAPHRLVELREPLGRRGDRKLPEALAEALPTLPGGATVLVVVAAQVDRRERWVRAFETHGSVVACEAPPRGRALREFIAGEARRQGLVLEPGVTELLAERIGPQLLVLRQELAKLGLLAGEGVPVTRRHAEVSACDVAEESVYELTDAIGEGRLGDALSGLAGLLRGGAAPPMVLGALAGHFRRLARIRAGADVPAPPFVRRKLEAQARRYPSARLVQCLRALHETDEALKGEGGVPADLALERLLLALDPGS
jgi:DNA polymerase-3 subunit delta